MQRDNKTIIQKYNHTMEEITSHQLTDVVSVTNFKGGVGKTTTVQTLAACLHKIHPGKRVVVMDLDPQCNLSFLLGWNDLRKTLPEYARMTIYDAMTKVTKIPIYSSPEGIFYVPGSAEMQNIDVSLFGQNIPRLVLAKCVMQGYFNMTQGDIDEKEATGNVFDDFDYMLIDCPPSLSQSTCNAMAMATTLLVPIQMEGLSVTGVGSILEQARQIQKELNPNLANMLLLPTMVNSQLIITNELQDFLENNFEDSLIPTPIHRSVKVAEAQTRMTNVINYAPNCRAAEDYMKVAKTIFGEE
ncbi:hypothetical protein PRBRB14_09710 [Hallella multisaccharivorax DSM 17128]|nr:hypothetical protein PRBRB14_09710 [Hallella multisaccharivorax DSM 17128]